MSKARTHSVRVDEIKRIMEDRGITIAELAIATEMSRKTITNILTKKSDPLEDNLVRIATALGVKWRTLVEGYERDPQEAESRPVITSRTKLEMIFDTRANRMTDEQAIEAIIFKLKGQLKSIDEVHIRIIRDTNEG